ncbi:MAG: hypothetical protein M3336_04870 [Chloroflexota bacterium]|nr:hypothetical protein [Chloroflexota bacterium]
MPAHSHTPRPRPFRSSAQEAILTLFRTASRLRRRFSAAVEPHGITLQQFNVLRILRMTSRIPRADVAAFMLRDGFATRST